jgi:hypothetical protein
LPPRAQAVSPEWPPISDEAIGNPFGEPPAQALAPFSAKTAEEIPPEPDVDAGHTVVAVSAAEDHLGEATLLSIQPFRGRGNSQITLMLLVGFLLLSVTAVGQVFRQPGADGSTVSVAASDAASPALSTGSDSSETARLFLASAEASMDSHDYELAASQLKKAVQELDAAGAPEIEIHAAMLLLARATFAEGKLVRAEDLCAQLDEGGMKVEAAQLSAQIQKELRKEALSSLVSARDDLKAGRLTPALQKARNAQAMLAKYGGSPEQVRAAKALIARAERAAAGLGIDRPRRRPPAAAAQTEVRRPLARPRLPNGYPRSRPAQPPAVPQASVSRPGSPDVSPASLPMATVMRGQRRQSTSQSGAQTNPGGQPPSNPEGPTPPQEGPGQPSAGAARVPVRPAASDTRRSRAGSNDVLPTYNSQGGGSAY